MNICMQFFNVEKKVFNVHNRNEYKGEDILFIQIYEGKIIIFLVSFYCYLLYYHIYYLLMLFLPKFMYKFCSMGLTKSTLYYWKFEEFDFLLMTVEDSWVIERRSWEISLRMDVGQFFGLRNLQAHNLFSLFCKKYWNKIAEKKKLYFSIFLSLIIFLIILYQKVKIDQKVIYFEKCCTFFLI